MPYSFKTTLKIPNQLGSDYGIYDIGTMRFNQYLQEGVKVVIPHNDSNSYGSIEVIVEFADPIMALPRSGLENMDPNPKKIPKAVLRFNRVFSEDDQKGMVDYIKEHYISKK